MVNKKIPTSVIIATDLNSINTTNNINCCFTCCQSIPDSVQKYVNLAQLCKILKLPASLLNTTSSSSILVCDSCIIILNEAITIHQEMEKLESQLEVINAKIKTLILRNFVPVEEDEESSQMSDSLYAIKKSLVQCWKDWTVPSNKFKGNAKQVEEEGINVYFEYLSHDEEATENNNCQLHKQNETETNKIIDILQQPLKVIPIERIRSQRIVKSRKRYGFDDDDQNYYTNVEIEIKSENSNKYNEKISLTSHIPKEGFVERPFKCDVINCNKSYKKKGHLEEHKKIHGVNGRPFVCHFCDNINNSSTLENPSSSSPPPLNAVISFSSEKKLQLHILAKHKSNKCEICDRIFKSSYVHARHLKSHELEANPIKNPVVQKKIFVCEFCGAKYSALKRLKIHQISHTADKVEPFCCKFPNCNKVFKESQTLQVHVASFHEKVFKYYCKVCGIGCQQIYMLNRHMLCHTNEKKFSCNVCGEKFKRKPQLISHEMKHTGQRPFSCSKCPKSFREKKKLKMHEFLHSGQKPHVCHCGKTFSLKHYLTHHINTIHKNKEINYINDNTSNKINVSIDDKIRENNNALLVECVNDSEIDSNLSSHVIILSASSSSVAENSNSEFQFQNNNGETNMITIETEDSIVPHHQIVLESVDQPKLVQLIQVIPNIQDPLPSDEEDPSQNFIQETVVYTSQEWIPFGSESNT